MTMSRREKDYFQYGLAAGIVVGFIILLGVLFAVEMPAGNKEASLILIGVLAGSFKDVVGYFFGSSKGSSEKTELLSGKPTE